MKHQLTVKDPVAGKDWSQEEKGMTGVEMTGITDSMDLNFSKLRQMVKDREAWRAAVHGVTKSQTWLTEQQNGDMIESIFLILQVFK